MAAANVQVKQEPVEFIDFEGKVLELCKETPKGITDAIIQEHLPNITPQQRVKGINRLLSTGQIELLKSGSKLIYRFKDSQSSSKTRGFDVEEKLIYQIIENAENKGVWIRDIRYKSNLQMTAVNKVLKNLESKKLIKAVNSVAAGKRKVYMLFNLEPDASVTGGAWYSDQDFEAEFVDILNQQCFKFLQQKAAQAQEMKVDPLLKRNRSYASSHEVWKFIAELGISKVSLSVQDIETILNTLIFDGKAEMIIITDVSSTGSSSTSHESNAVQKKLFRAVKPVVPVPGLMRVPCGVCPVAKNCYPGGAVSPQTCIYLKDWLD
ncbi:DNA-directed RNA polymerase III subunit RPC6-like [Clytia hemisphaerica]|uniref:DNA-directed RNA polymerase III subunit RPC6 n=1 Tax=Clytia hemisphaerica TaxID=252671 RepID=A0A7M5WJS1_9CNID